MFAVSFQLEGVAGFGVFLLVLLVLCGIIILFFSPAIIVSALLRKRAERYKNERVNTVVAQYEPPHDLTPAQIGLLYEMKCDQAEVEATVLHLHVRSVIAVEGRNSVRVTDRQAYDKLEPYEQLALHIYDTRMPAPEETVTLPGLKPSLETFTNFVRESLQHRGIPVKSFRKAFWGRVFLAAFLLAQLPFLTVATSGTFNGNEYGPFSVDAFISAFIFVFFGYLFLTPVYVFISYVVLKIWTKIAGRYWVNTKQARKLWPEIQGYKLFLEQVEIDNIQFESQTSDELNVEKVLPYAVAFRLTTDWEKRFRT